MKKRLPLILLAGLNLLLIASITMSVAWFFGARELYIDGIDVSINADADLFVSLDDNFEHAKHSLNSDDFGPLEKFQPVSTQGAEHSEWINDTRVDAPKFMEQYRSSNTGHPQPTVAERGFFSKKIYLFCTRTMLITFDSANTIVKPKESLNNSLAFKKARDRAETEYLPIAQARIEAEGVTDPVRIEEIKQEVKTELINQYKPGYKSDLDSITNSVRISLFDHANLGDSHFTVINPKMDEEKVVFGGRLNTSTTSPYYNFYSDSTGGTTELKEILYGDIKTQDHEIVYDPAPAEDIPVVGIPTCFNAGTKAGVRPINTADLASNVEFYTEQSVTPEYADASVSQHSKQGYVVRLEAGKAHPLNLSVYIEGWDRDNTNCTIEGSFEMSVNFKIYREAEL